MWTKFNKAQDGTEIYFEPAQQKPTAIIFDSEFLELLGKIDDDTDNGIWDVMIDLEAAREEAETYEAQADEAYSEARYWEDCYDDVQGDLADREAEIEDLAAQIKDLERTIADLRKIEGAVEDLERTINDLRNENTELRDALAEAGTDLANCEELVEALREQIDAQ